MNESLRATELYQRWCAGDESAATPLFELFAQRLAALADKQLSARLARRVEGEDIVQSVFRTFFRRSARGEFQIQRSAELWQLLVKITLAKVRSQARRHTSGKRDVGAEVNVGDEHWLLAAVANEPGPEEAAVLVEQIEAILAGLPPGYGEILTLRLEGHARSEIADRLGISRMTVHRALKLMQQRLDRMMQDLT
jgi:RNA polymerase sigma-70 factor (ECF subfamily)